MPQVVFTTARLVARRWTHADIDAVEVVYGDADAMRWVGDGQPITRAECEQWMEVTFANYRTRGYGMFTLEDESSVSVIGFAGIVHPGGQSEPEIKYALLRAHWGRGVATEAAAGLLEYGATHHRLSRIIATTHPANIASHRVLLKAGMERGELRPNADGSQTLLFIWRAPAGASSQSSSSAR